MSWHRWVLALALALPWRAWGQQGWSPEVRALVSKLENEPASSDREESAPLAVFDFDNTMILGDISHTSLVLQAQQRRYGFEPSQPNEVLSATATRLFALQDSLSGQLVPGSAVSDVMLGPALVHEALARYERLRDDEGKPAALRYLARSLLGFTPAQVRQLSLDALAAGRSVPVCARSWRAWSAEQEALVQHQGIRRREPIAAMAAHLQELGFELWVVSASPQPMVQAVAQALYGLPPERVLGVRSVEEEGRVGFEVLSPITWRQGKVEAIQQHVGRRPVLVFGDAWTDWEMLTWAQHGVLIDRGKEELRQAALEAGLLVQPRFEGEPDPKLPCQGE